MPLPMASPNSAPSEPPVQKSAVPQPSRPGPEPRRSPVSRLLGWFKPAKHIPRLPDAEVQRLYPKFRWSVLEATFLGYGLFYLVRNNLAVVAKDMENALGYNHTQIGTITAVTAIAYGLGKLLMGSVSDRSDPRKFMAMGLMATAICNFAFGALPGYNMQLALWSLNGFIQGMGWAPCGRSMGHWFSVRERGTTFSVWNTSHNVGGGVAGWIAAWAVLRFGGWQYAFFIPGVIAAIGSVYVFMRLVDTPQSVGLPSIEEYKQDFTAAERKSGTVERELTTKELFVDNVLLNKYIWLLAFANFFAYVCRYSMWDWGPMYLREVKHADITQGSIAVMVENFGGIVPTIVLGWWSDKLGGRRGMVATLCMVPVVLAFVGLIVNPPGHLWLDYVCLTIVGCFIYPVINIFTILALDFTSKKAIGTAAGFLGLFGYVARASQAVGFGKIADYYGKLHGQAMAWNLVLYLIVACGVLCIAILALMWKAKPRG
jgi:MFS transporter, OPA family, glycerol-3-phosphate transporter